MPSEFEAGESANRRQFGEFKRVNRIVREGVIMVPPFLSSPKDGEKADDIRTEIRLFPRIENGDVYQVLNPAATSETPLRKRLANVFLDLEMVRGAGGLGGRGIETDMITSVLRTAAGEDAPQSFFSPYREFVFRLQQKIKEQVARAQYDLPMDIPRTWYKYHSEGGFKKGVKFGKMPFPQGRGNKDRDTGKKRPDLYMVKCGALHINGTSKKDPKTGNLRWQGPCVFPIPMSAVANFFDALTTRRDEDAPLSPSNNSLGDCFSLDEGCLLKLKKLDDGDYVLRLGRKQKMSFELAQKYCMPWEELIHIPTVEESIEWINEAFGDPAMIDYAFRPVDGNAKSGRWYEFVPEDWKGLSRDISEPLSPDALQALAKKSGKSTSSEDEKEDVDDLPFEGGDDDVGVPDKDAEDDVDLSDVPDGVDADRYKESLSNMRTMLEDGDGKGEEAEQISSGEFD